MNEKAQSFGSGSENFLSGFGASDEQLTGQLARAPRLANASTALHLAAAGGREIIDLLVRH